jgi:hypothetical protein
MLLLPSTNTRITDVPCSFSSPCSTPAQPSTTRRIPPSKINVAEIEASLHLAPAQSRQLRDLIRDEMATCGVLGTLKFSPQLAAQEKEMLQRILDKAKRDLPFLQETGLTDQQREREA